MLIPSPTFASLTASPPHRSFWREGLIQRADQRILEDWLIEQANLRGFHGTWVVPTGVVLDPVLTLEEIIVGLCAPHAEADGRVFKLVLRIFQSGRVDAVRLARLARMERAEGVIYWVLRSLPDVERTAAVDEVAAHFATEPRGYRGVDYHYDFGRLIKRPYIQGAAWTRPPAS